MNDSLSQQLESLFAPDEKSAKRMESESISRIPDLRTGVVLYGGGVLGRYAAAHLSAAGVRVIAFADRNAAKWGTSIDGVPVHSLADISRKHGFGMPIVVTIFTGAVAMREQLRAEGFQTVVSSTAAFLKCGSNCLPFGSIDFPHKLHAERADIRAAFALWSDEFSRVEYLAQIRYRLFLSEEVPACEPLDRMYFIEEQIPLLPDETFVDCGAFDGDTIRATLKRCGSTFHKIVALEPDPATYERLRKFVATLPADLQGRFQIVQKAVASSTKTLRFDAVGTMGSHLQDDGTIEVECVPLDTLLSKETPTYIKMDVEGAEPDALLGARRVIQEHQPVLAISLYHRQNDLWRIPLLIHSINKEYRFLLRRYCDDWTEQVMYAVPSSRLKNK